MGAWGQECAAHRAARSAHTASHSAQRLRPSPRQCCTNHHFRLSPEPSLPARLLQVAGYVFLVFYFAGLAAEILLVTLWLRLLPWLVGMPARWAAGRASVFSIAANACHTIFFSDVYEALLETPLMAGVYLGLGFKARQQAQFPFGERFRGVARFPGGWDGIQLGWRPRRGKLSPVW